MGMADVLGLSKSRFYALIQAGIFPRPAYNEFCKRPVFDADLQNKCLEVRRSGIGCNGQPVLFNRKRRQDSKQRTRQRRPAKTDEQAEIVEALKSLGLVANAEEVECARRELYPQGAAGIDAGEVVRQVFLQLRGGQCVKRAAISDK